MFLCVAAFRQALDPVPTVRNWMRIKSKVPLSRRGTGRVWDKGCHTAYRSV